MVYRPIGVGDARKQIERALKWSEQEDVGVIYEHYGDILVKVNEIQNARDAYQKALDSGEDPGRIQPKIDKLAR